MNLKKIMMIAGCLFMLTACTNQPDESILEPETNQPPELTKLKVDPPVDQQPSNRAKKLLSDHDEVKSVRAVNHDNYLLVGVQLNHHDRFNKDDNERELRNKINENSPDMKVKLSTDEKIHLEVEKLEKTLQKKNLSEKELKKKISKIKSLSEEET